MAVDDESAEKKSKTQASYRCYLAVEQFMQRVAAQKKRQFIWSTPWKKANLKFEAIFNIHAYIRALFPPSFFSIASIKHCYSWASKGFEK